jgi:hypothetical protein
MGETIGRIPLESTMDPAWTPRVRARFDPTTAAPTRERMAAPARTSRMVTGSPSRIPFP